MPLFQSISTSWIHCLTCLGRQCKAMRHPYECSTLPSLLGAFSFGLYKKVGQQISKILADGDKLSIESPCIRFKNGVILEWRFHMSESIGKFFKNPSACGRAKQEGHLTNTNSTMSRKLYGCGRVAWHIKLKQSIVLAVWVGRETHHSHECSTLHSLWQSTFP
jgi:hypothetical protein